MGPAASVDKVGMAAIIIGTSFIAWSGILVRFADVGPLTSAAWRMIIAVPALYAWSRVLSNRRDTAGTSKPIRFSVLVLPLIAAGVAFASDVASFHFSLSGTSVANASFIGNISSIVAVVGGALFFAEHPDRRVWGALMLALAGSWVMAGMLTPQNLAPGDLWALSAAMSYAAYLLVIKRLRVVLDGPAATMWSAVVTAIVLTAAALWFEPVFFPQTVVGWFAVLALGIGSHALGQGLTSIAIGRVPVGIIAVIWFAQPPVSTLLAWLVLGEAIDAYQIAGGAIIMVALVLARPR